MKITDHLHDLVRTLRTLLPNNEKFPMIRTALYVDRSFRSLVRLPTDAALFFQKALCATRPPTHICIRTYEDDSTVILDRCHIDRSHDDGRPMLRTCILYMDDDTRSATCFPYLGKSIQGHFGRLLTFSSVDPSSAHYGVRLAPGVRTVAIIGWNGHTFDLDGHHEGLEHAAPEERAYFLGRTLEEELVGWLGGPRQGEAQQRLRQIAHQRRLSIEELVLATRRESSPPPTPQIAPPHTASPPDHVYESQTCPVCQDDNVHMLVLQCGHMVCPMCRDTMLGRRELCSAEGHLRCPLCRIPSPNAWPSQTMLEV